MARYISAVDTAKLLRKALKASFPGTRFSVRTSTYAGGASIRVGYTDGPAYTDVDKLARSFAGATFDGMRDLKEYRTSELNGEAVRFGADFVFVERRYTVEFLLDVAADLGMNLGEIVIVETDYGGARVVTDDYHVQQEIYRAAQAKGE